MILVTGGTGFIGQALIRQLVAAGHPVRTLIRPSRRTPNLPKGVPIEIAVCSLDDERGLRAAMKDVHVVYHLAGAESQGSRADLMHVDIRGTQSVARAANEAKVERLFFLSHLGADRASAYPVLKAKAIAENFIKLSGVNYTILRSAVVYGPSDHFSTGLAATLHASPGIFVMPGDGKTLLQPLWVEDLVTCLMWALEDSSTAGVIFPIGGAEYLSLEEITQTIINTLGIRRSFLHVSPAYMRGLTVLMEHSIRNFPLSVFWLDYFATDRTGPLDTLPRVFGLLPARFSQHVDYLKNPKLQRSLARLLTSQHRSR